MRPAIDGMRLRQIPREDGPILVGHGNCQSARIPLQWENCRRGLSDDMVATAADIPELIKDLPPGAWVAISIDRHKVVAYGPDAQAVLDEAREEGEKIPLIVRVPEQNVAMFL